MAALCDRPGHLGGNGDRSTESCEIPLGHWRSQSDQQTSPPTVVKENKNYLFGKFRFTCKPVL